MDDLSAFDTLSASENGREMVVLKPGSVLPFMSDGKPWKITLLGEDSVPYRNAKHTMKRRVYESHAAGNPIIGRSLDALLAEVAGECTVGWSGISMSGSAVDFTKEKAAEIYLKFPWLLDQVMNFIENRVNFLPEPSASLENGSVDSSDSAE